MDDSKMSGQPLVSVIVPVYNVEKYLVECLDSIVSQDYPNMEIVAVDDGSTDGSLKVLSSYAATHPNVRVMHQENAGAGVARNKGVSSARGKYVWFVDPDDVIETGAIRELVSAAEEKSAEIILFAIARYDAEIKTLLKASPQPKPGMTLADVFSGKDIADRLYTTFSDGPSPCNKLFLRKFIEDNRLEFQALPRVNDLCFSYSALALANRIHVIGRAFYKYRTSRKGSSQNTTDKDPSPVCAAYRKLNEVLASAKVFGEFARSFYMAFYNSCSYTFSQMKRPATAEKLLNLLRSGDLAGIAGAKLGRDAFGSDAEFAAYAGFWKETDPLRLMIGAPQRGFFNEMPDFPRDKGRRTLGIICASLRPGGMERVITQLIPIFVANGFDVVLMTRHEPSPEEYPLPQGCVRVIICNDNRRQPRYDRIRATILKYGIDTVIDHEYYLLNIGIDIEAIHSTGAKAVIHHHSVFSNMFMRDNRERALPGLIKAYRSADAMITLSDTDADFFNIMGCRAVRITNPVPVVPKPVRNKPDNHVVIWVARFVDGKQPLDAVKIFERVLMRVPDARFVMLGDGEPGQVKMVRDHLAARPRLRRSMSMPGYKTDVFAYEQDAGVFLTTTKFDGFSLSIIEAKAMGLPVVSYAMPYLETVRPGTGAVTVPQGDIAGAADMIAQIFNNDALRAELSRQSRESYECFAGHDQWTSYSRLISALDGETAFPKPTVNGDSTEIILKTLIEHVDVAFSRTLAKIALLQARESDVRKKLAALQADESQLSTKASSLQSEVSSKNRPVAKSAGNDKTIAALEKQIRGLKFEVDHLKTSEAYRTGMFITWPARKAWGGVKCLRENGFKYTVKHAIGKVMRLFGSKIAW